MLNLHPPAILALPPAISTNALFENNPFGHGQGRGRRVSKKYRAWRTTAHEYLNAQRPLPKFPVPVDLTLFIGMRGTGVEDVDNCNKALIDALVSKKIIPDDSRKWVRSANTIWVPDLYGCAVKIAQAEGDPRADDVLRFMRSNGRELLRG